MYDIVIVGSGIVGATAALRLAKNTSLNIAVVEASVPNHDWSPLLPYGRVSAISLASKNIFEQVACWSKIKEKRISPYTDMHVWDAEGSGQIHFDAPSIAEGSLGYIIEDHVMRSSLLEAFQHYQHLSYLCPVTLTGIQETTEGIVLSTSDGKTITAKLLIAADGANSWVRQSLGIDVNTWEYEHTAIVATVKTERPHQKTAWQRFLPTGPLAFLPLSEPNLCSIVWSLEPAYADKWLALDDAEFANELSECFEHRLGAVQLLTPRHAFPLRMRHAKNYVRTRVALVGDAAHTIHPLAGQGVNLGLHDAAALADVIITAWKKNRDYASLATLRKYERARKTDNVLMLAMVECLKRLFANPSTFVKSLRNTGLNMTNQSIIKTWLARYAVGLR